MGIIHQLTPLDAQYIAAGLIIQRPADVIKELLENALDAQATHITIRLNQAGKTFIEVADNGSGMDQDDAITCLKSRTTSKIATYKDIARITTFGFRGEALSALCSMAQVTITTKRSNDQLAVNLITLQGTIKSIKIIPGSNGTSVCVEQLFDHHPHKKQFLKSESTELKAVEHLLNNFCMSHPNVSFKLFNDQVLLKAYPAIKGVNNRLLQIIGSDNAPHLLTISAMLSAHERLEGVISNQQIWRHTKNYLFFLINNRPVHNPHLKAALIRGYDNSLKKGYFPLGVIHLSLNTHMIDINVDATKHEVLLSNAQHIDQSLSKAVRAALSAQHSTSQCNTPVELSLLLPQAASSVISSTSDIKSTECNFIGQLHATYCMFSSPEGLLIIDQHAAHEAIIYAQLAQCFQEADCIELMFPSIINVQAHENTHMLEQLFALQAFSIKRISPHQLIVRSVPLYCKEINLQELVEYTLELLSNYAYGWDEDVQKKVMHVLRAQMACKAAIKAGQVIEKTQAEELLNQLLSTDQNSSCPHGRPTRWLFDMHYIEKIFKRRK